MTQELLKDRVRQTCRGSGQGTLDIGSGAAATGYRKVSDAYSTGESGVFVLESNGAWEIFYGSRATDTTLTRVTVIESTNSNQKIILDSNLVHIVYCDLNAAGYAFIGSDKKLRPARSILIGASLNTYNDLVSAGSGFGVGDAGVTYLVLGYSSAGDGGGGFYRWSGTVWERLFLRKLGKISTMSSGDATPSVRTADILVTAGTTKITNFDDGELGQTLNIFRGASDITIENNGNIDLAGSDITLTSDEPSIQLIYVTDGSLNKWRVSAGGVGGGGQKVEVIATGDGSTVNYTLSGAANTSIIQTDVYVSGVHQRRGTDYTVANSGNNLIVTLATAPRSGVSVEVSANTKTRFKTSAVASTAVTHGGSTVGSRLDTDRIYSGHSPQSTTPTPTTLAAISFNDGSAGVNGYGAQGAGYYQFFNDKWAKIQVGNSYIDSSTYGTSLAALQEAVDDASASGSILKIAPGTYDFGLGTLDVTSGYLIIEGCGESTLIKRTVSSGSGTQPQALVRYRNGASGIVRDLALTSDVEFLASGGYSDLTENAAIKFTNSNRASVQNCKVYHGFYLGISFDSCLDVSVIGNTVKGMNNRGIYIYQNSRNIRILGNYVDGRNASGTVVTSYCVNLNPANQSIGGTNSLNRIVVNDNTFYKYTAHGVGIGDVSGQVVCSGNSIEGIQGDAVGSAGVVFWFGNHHRVQKSVISNNNIRYSTHGVNLLQGDNVIVANNMIDSPNATGVFCAGSNRAIITGNNITSPLSTAGGGGYGIYALGISGTGQYGAVEDVVISNNYINLAAAMGIRTQGGISGDMNRVLINGNIVVNSVSQGIYVDDTVTKAIITSNISLGNGSTQLYPGTGNTSANNITS